MEKLINKIRRDYPVLKFQQGKTFYWSPKTQEIFIDSTNSRATAKWSLLHEVGHALLEHKDYKTDIELLNIEVTAWEKAKELSVKYTIKIEEKHIQECLGSYRDWLYRRAVCPLCGSTSSQHDTHHLYECFNCRHTWEVSSSRFCRPYRRTNSNKKSSATIFAADDLVL